MADLLSGNRQLTVLSALGEGSSSRSTERLTGVRRDTIIRLIVRVGNGCANPLSKTMGMGEPLDAALGCEESS